MAEKILHTICTNADQHSLLENQFDENKLDKLPKLNLNVSCNEIQAINQKLLFVVETAEVSCSKCVISAFYFQLNCSLKLDKLSFTLMRASQFFEPIDDLEKWFLYCFAHFAMFCHERTKVYEFVTKSKVAIVVLVLVVTAAAVRVTIRASLSVQRHFLQLGRLHELGEHAALGHVHHLVHYFRHELPFLVVVVLGFGFVDDHLQHACDLCFHFKRKEPVRGVVALTVAPNRR